MLLHIFARRFSLKRCVFPRLVSVEGKTWSPGLTYVVIRMMTVRNVLRMRARVRSFVRVYVGGCGELVRAIGLWEVLSSVESGAAAASFKASSPRPRLRPEPEPKPEFCRRRSRASAVVGAVGRSRRVLDWWVGMCAAQTLCHR